VSKKKSTKRQQKFKTIFTRSQREGKRKQNAEYKRKLREDTNYKEKGAQQARRRYHKKQEQLQFLQEQLRYQQEIIKLSQEKIEFMSSRIYNLKATLNLASLDATTAKANLETLTVELQQAKSY
jgi:hypothetical protein